MATQNCKRLWCSDYGDVWLKRVGEKIYLMRYTPLDYEYMEEYISDRVDFRSEWQEDVWNWNTEDWYETWRDNYSYDYDEYFNWDSETGEYYQEDDDNTLWDSFITHQIPKDEVVNRIMEYFDDDYSRWDFTRASDMDRVAMRNLVSEYYDNCIEKRRQMDEARKPHWNAFNYYK